MGDYGNGGLSMSCVSVRRGSTLQAKKKLGRQLGRGITTRAHDMPDRPVQVGSTLQEIDSYTKVDSHDVIGPSRSDPNLHSY